MTDALLGGTRGRRLCYELVNASSGSTGPSLDGRALAAGLAGAVAAMDLEDLTATSDPRALLPALADAVSWAAYWQEPDEVDGALQDVAVARALAPVADAVAACRAAAWWTDGVALSDQRHLRWHPVEPGARGPTPAEALLATWRAAVVAEEERARRERPADPAAPYSGCWWSSPALSGLLATTTTLPGSGLPVGLALLEDAFGAERAEVVPVRVDAAVRVYEVTGPTAWAELAAAYTLAVTRARGHDWFRVTGWRGEWVVPDWAAVARDWDGVHLTVAGYLSTAGRLLRPDPARCHDARTLLAGWDAGTTWWLADVTSLGPPAVWQTASDPPLDWAPA